MEHSVGLGVLVYDCACDPPAHLVAPAQGAAQLSDSDVSQGDSDDN